MKNIDFKRDILPHLIIIVGFLVLSFAYLSPMLKGQVLNQHDIRQWEGSFHQIREFNELTGQKTLWTNAMFSGMPTYQIYLPYQADTFIIKYLRLAILKIIPHPANSLFAYMLGFYLLMMAFRVNKWLAAIGAIAFAFGTYNVIILEAGHATKSYAIAFAPMVLAGIIFTLHTRHKLLGMALTGIALATEVKVNHIQITYYLFLLVLILGIVEMIYAARAKNLKDFFLSVGVLVIAAGLGVLSNATNLALTYEYGQYSTRGPSELTQPEQEETSGLDYTYAMEYSYGLAETFNLLVPNFMGGASAMALDEDSETYQTLEQNAGRAQARSIIEQMPTYWGPQRMTSGPVYIGAIIVALFVLGLFIVPGPAKWWLLFGTILSIFLAWGKHFPFFSDFFFNYFPFYNKFRTVSMTLVVAQITFPVMAMLALQQVIFNRENWNTDRLLNFMKYTAYIVGGLLLVFILFAGTFFDFVGAADAQLPEWLRDTIVEDRESLLRSDAFRSLIFILLTGGLLWLWLKDKVKLAMVLGGIAVLVLVDLWAVDKRFFDNEDFVTERKRRNSWARTPADEFILADEDDHYRVLNLTVSPFNDATTSYHHRSIGGYHGAKLGRYQELIERGVHPDLQDLRQAGFSQTPVLNMLDTRYVITGPTADKVIRNPQALGSAWFVDRIRIVENADEEIAAIREINPANTVLVDQRYADVVEGFDPNPSANDRIELVAYEQNKVLYRTNTEGPQFAVFSDVYYNNDKGWEAYIDGELVPHIRVNYILRGMKIPAGEHEITFVFEPKTYKQASTAAYAGSIALVVLLLVGIGVEWKRKND